MLYCICMFIAMAWSWIPMKSGRENIFVPTIYEKRVANCQKADRNLKILRTFSHCFTVQNLGYGNDIDTRITLYMKTCELWTFVFTTHLGTTERCDICTWVHECQEIVALIAKDLPRDFLFNSVLFLGTHPQLMELGKLIALCRLQSR